MRSWLFKSEPNAYSIDDLARDGTEPWDGIRNYQVRNMIRDDMSVGDRILFYHSNAKPPAVVGVAEIMSDAYPDPTAFDQDSKYFDPKSDPDNPRWLLVDVRYVSHLERHVSLSEMKDDPELVGMAALAKGSRLSILPVDDTHFEHILRLGAAE